MNFVGSDALKSIKKIFFKNLKDKKKIFKSRIIAHMNPIHTSASFVIFPGAGQFHIEADSSEKRKVVRYIAL